MADAGEAVDNDALAGRAPAPAGGDALLGAETAGALGAVVRGWSEAEAVGVAVPPARGVGALAVMAGALAAPPVAGGGAGARPAVAVGAGGGEAGRSVVPVAEPAFDAAPVVAAVIAPVAPEALPVVAEDAGLAEPAAGPAAAVDAVPAGDVDAVFEAEPEDVAGRGALAAVLVGDPDPAPLDDGEDTGSLTAASPAAIAGSESNTVTVRGARVSTRPELLTAKGAAHRAASGRSGSLTGSDSSTTSVGTGGTASKASGSSEAGGGPPPHPARATANPPASSFRALLFTQPLLLDNQASPGRSRPTNIPARSKRGTPTNRSPAGVYGDRSSQPDKK